MSGWDAPTGSWNSRQEPDESGGSADEQGYQQGEPTGGYRTVRGGEGRLRAGRRGLPGYDQAQNYDQPTVRYDQGSGYGQQGYGPATGPQPDMGSGTGAGQMVRYGQRPADEPAFGSGPRDALGSGPQRPLGPGPQDPLSPGPQSTFNSGPRRAIGSGPPSPQVPQAAPGSGPRGAVGYGEGATGAYRQYGADEPTRSGWSDASGQPGYGDRQGYGDQPGYGSAAQPGQDYGQSGFAANSPNAANGPAGQPGPDLGYGEYGTQPGYGQPGHGQPGYGQPGYGQQASGPAGFPPGGSGGQADQSRTGQDYQAEAYPQPASEPSDYPQNGFGPDPGVTQAYGTQPGYGQNGFVPNAPNIPNAQNPPSVPGAPNGQVTNPSDGYGQGGFAPPGSRQDGYPPDPYPEDPYPEDPYTQDPYTQDGYGQGGYVQDGYGQGFEQPGGPALGDDSFDSRGPAPRSRPGSPRSGQRPPQRLGGARMALYLAASVVGVVVIVFLVMYLTKSPENKAASGSSTPGAGTTTAAGAGAQARATGLVLTQAPKVGNFLLNKVATTAVAAAARSESAPVATALKAKGAGQPGKAVTAVYDLGPVRSITSSAYKGIVFVGYDGTYNPAAVIKIVRSHLVSSRVVKPGPNGGEMVCGYSTTGGSEASECVWVTKTTFGVVEFIKGDVPAKYPGASNLALEVRNAVEVHAS